MSQLLMLFFWGVLHGNAIDLLIFNVMSTCLGLFYA